MPLPTAILLPNLLPLILDGSSSVRKQLIKLLRCLPAEDVRDRVESALLYARAGMTHLAEEIRSDTVDLVQWLVEIAGLETVSSPGGWVKMLVAFMSMMGWARTCGDSKWTAASRSTFGKAGKALPKQMIVLSQFLSVGLRDEATLAGEISSQSKWSGIWDTERHLFPQKSDAYAHLNLFGSTRDEESKMYRDREDRQRIFAKRFLKDIEQGVESARKEGGEAGRAAAILSKTLKESTRGSQIQA